MHFNFDFFSHQFLWALTFAAQVVLLAVLLGRDRARRYPWFTAGIVLAALQLMAGILLSGRIAMLPLQEIMLALADIDVIVGLMVLVELAQKAFTGATRSQWIANTVGLVIVAGGLLMLWGPWPAWTNLGLGTLLGDLRMMQLVAQKGSTLVDLLTVGLGLVVGLFGHRFKAGWRSYPQMIVIGLSAVAIAWLAVQQTWLILLRKAYFQSQEQLLSFSGKLVAADKIVYLAALVWWIVWLWLDEPGTATALPAEAEPEPEQKPEQTEL